MPSLIAYTLRYIFIQLTERVKSHSTLLLCWEVSRWLNFTGGICFRLILMQHSSSIWPRNSTLKLVMTILENLHMSAYMTKITLAIFVWIPSLYYRLLDRNFSTCTDNRNYALPRNARKRLLNMVYTTVTEVDIGHTVINYTFLL